MNRLYTTALLALVSMSPMAECANIAPHPTRLTTLFTPSPARAGRLDHVYVRLTDKQSHARLVGALISAVDQDGNVYAGVTDSAGLVRFDVVFPVAGTGEMHFSFAGNASYTGTGVVGTTPVL